MRKKKIIPGELHHVYQRSFDRGLLFYSSADALTYFTICMTMAKKYDICVIGLCEMFDHVHKLVIPVSSSSMSKFEMETNRLYAGELNKDIGRRGQVFEHSFDFAVRKDPKKARSSIIYLYNNPVEKKLSDSAIEARWNFLAYGFSDHPFSTPLYLGKASNRMRKCIDEVKAFHAQDKHLNQSQLRRMFKSLTAEERNQLCDFIVRIYSAIDYERLFSYWKSSSEMLTAMNSTTGAEFGINEGRDNVADDRVYYRMMKALPKSIKEILKTSKEKRYAVASYLQKRTGASLYQTYKFLHLPLKQ